MPFVTRYPMRKSRFSISTLVQLLIVGLASLAMASCTDTRGGSIPYNVSDFGAPDSPTPQALANDYKIAPMDTLTIKVFGLADLSGDYQVDLLGNIALPLIGDIAAVDLTPAELDRRLTEKYGEKYLQNPDVSVGIKSSAGRFVTVDGAVKKGGAYPVIGKISLMQAVALAGGTDDHANQRRVAIFRTINGKRQAAAFDLLSIRHGEMPDPPVYSGDIVVVDGSNLKEAQKKFFQSIPLFAIFSPI
jgi:polysaccharide export outer membrane protein